MSDHVPVHLKSPNAIDPAQTYTAFLLSVLAGARRFAHTSLLRADRALHAVLTLILDTFSRRVIGWALERTLEAALTLEALRRALVRQRLQKLR